MNSWSSESGRGLMQIHSVEVLENMVKCVNGQAIVPLQANMHRHTEVESTAHLMTPGAEGHEEHKCSPCINFSKGACKKGSQCIRCHLPHTKRPKKKRMRPPPSVRLGKAIERSGGLTPEEAKEKQQQFQQMLEQMLARACEDGDAFDMETAEYIPQFVKENTYLRERFTKTLQIYVSNRSAALPASDAAAASSGGAIASDDRNMVHQQPQQPQEEGHSSDELFSL